MYLLSNNLFWPFYLNITVFSYFYFEPLCVCARHFIFCFFFQRKTALIFSSKFCNGNDQFRHSEINWIWKIYYKMLLIWQWPESLTFIQNHFSLYSLYRFTLYCLPRHYPNPLTESIIYEWWRSILWLGDYHYVQWP